MTVFLKSAKKAFGGGASAALAVVGITWSELDWKAIIAAFVVGAVGTYFTPKNVEQPAE